MNTRLGYIFIILTTIIWGTNPVMFKFLSGFASANVQNFFRFLIAGIVIWIYSKYLIKRGKISDSDEKNKGFLKFIPPAIIFYIFAQLFITGVGMSKATITSFIIAGIGPIITIIFLSIFIPEERAQLKNIYLRIAIVIGFISVVLVMLNFNNGLNVTPDLGLILVLLATVAWSVYTTCVKKYYSEVNSIIFVRNIILLSALFCFITIICTKEIFLLKNISPTIIFSLIIAGLIADAFCNIAFFIGVTNVSGVKANSIFLMAPIISTIVSKIVFNESLTQLQLTGCIMIFISGILLIVMELKKSKIHLVK